MCSFQDMVRVFHETFGALISSQPTVLDDKGKYLRHRLIAEEVEELKDAIEADDLVGIADALGDILYVTFGAGVSFGIDLTPVFNEIHRSNMTKIGPDGEINVREDGKILKPETFSKPDIKGILKLQGWRKPKTP